jgi:hypothetical protein
MAKRDKPESAGSTRPSGNGRRAVATPGRARTKTPERSKWRGQSAGHGADTPRRSCCLDCMFCVSSVVLWMRTRLSRFPTAGMCMNHADAPGLLQPIPYVPCRNFRPRPDRPTPPQPADPSIRHIPLSQGRYAIVDTDDYDRLMRHKWHACRSGRHRTYYARRTTRDGRVILMHREIARPPKGRVVDHINGNGLDNRKGNLRVCTQAENALNSRRQARAKSKYRGVTVRGDKYEARIKYKGKTYCLGRFNTALEAAHARDQKALDLYGQYAWLNIPPAHPIASPEPGRPGPV